MKDMRKIKVETVLKVAMAVILFFMILGVWGLVPGVMVARIAVTGLISIFFIACLYFGVS